MGKAGALLELAQHPQLGLARRRRLDDQRGIFEHPAALCVDGFARHAGMDRDDRQLPRVRVGLEDAKVGDHPGRPLRPDAESLAASRPLAVAERGDERQLVDESARRHRHGDEDLAAMDGDLRRAAAAGQPHLGLADSRRRRWC